MTTRIDGEHRPTREMFATLERARQCVLQRLRGELPAVIGARLGMRSESVTSCLRRYGHLVGGSSHYARYVLTDLRLGLTDDELASTGATRQADGSWISRQRVRRSY